MKRRSFLQLAAGLPMWAQATKQPPKTEWIAWVGTYTRGTSKGIYAWRWIPGEHKFTALGLAAETSNPSFVAVHPNQKFLYAVNEENAGGVSAFHIDEAGGQLKLLNRVSSHGSGPCHLVVDRGGRWVYVANYGSGSVAALPVQPDGSLQEASVFAQHSGSSVNPQRQKGPHAHSTVVSPDNRFLLVADLGLDQVMVYPIEGESGGLNVREASAVKLAPGSGPRHIVFRPDGKFVYVTCEMSASVTVFRYTPQRPTLEELQTVPLVPEGYSGNRSGAEIAVRGPFLYASIRGYDAIAGYRIDAATGRLTALGHTPTQGKTPRSFAIDPTGAYLLAANQDSDNVVLFRIDGRTGALTPAGETWTAGSPVCVAFSTVR
ncbi:MAG: lactonase family protein [Acidobacteriota bacterium]|nr:lactonase family protein [Acidobacteriota bacterium]